MKLPDFLKGSDLLDFLMVVEEHRRVVLISPEASESNIERFIVEEQLTDFTFISFPQLNEYIFCTKAKEGVVRAQINTFNKSNRTHWRDLFTLLGYPDCCVEEFTRRMKAGIPQPVIEDVPYIPCSKSCTLDWPEHYAQIRAKYGL